MNECIVTSSWTDPEARPFEIAERKGLGHPDTIADGLADAISNAYSKHCLKDFGLVPHHNVDKVYIGGGHFTVGYERARMYAPVRVVVNGRMSSCFGKTAIPIRDIQERAVRQYLKMVLPGLNQESELIIVPNATQHTQRPYWYTPRGPEDIPDTETPKANDTSLCVAHAPFSTTERLAFELERFFWTSAETDLTALSPRLCYVGQDIKVMVLRINDRIDITVCVPMLSRQTTSFDEYMDKVAYIECRLQAEADRITVRTRFTPHVGVNRTKQGRRLYLLGMGSCVECGEEGVVGRGNPIGGVIASGRAHSVEAPYGKNPVYHTGKVLGFLTQKLAWSIYAALGEPVSVHALTVNSQSLLPPHTLIVETAKAVGKKKLRPILDSIMESDYVSDIIASPLAIRTFSELAAPRRKGPP